MSPPGSDRAALPTLRRVGRADRQYAVDGSRRHPAPTDRSGGHGHGLVGAQVGKPRPVACRPQPAGPGAGAAVNETAPLPRPTVAVVVGVDGSGRTHRLRALAAAHPGARWVTPPGPPVDALRELLASAAAQRDVVLVDDAHLLDLPVLQLLLSGARTGLTMTISRRPTIELAELAALDAALAATGPVEVLAALPPPALAELLAAATASAPDPEAVAALLRDSGGLAAVAVALAGTRAGTVAPALVARVQRRVAVLDPGTVRVARILALGLDLPDEVLAAAAGLDPELLAAALRTLRDEGLLAPPGERMVPAVAEVVVADLAPAQLRRVHDAVALGLLAVGGDVLGAAARLRTARARSGRAAEVYRAAGEQLRFSDPAAAGDWFDDALDAGADPALLAAGRAEAQAQLGLQPDPNPPAGVAAEQRHRLQLVEGAVAAQQGRAGRAADVLLAAAEPGPVLAVPSLVAVGRLAEATAHRAGPAPTGLRRLAEAALRIGDPAAAVAGLIEAAEATETARPEVVLPDTAHALAAVVAVTAGDASTADHVLRRALAAGVGGPAADRRHQLLLAWVRMRAGRFDTAVGELARHAGAPLPGRERLLYSALEAGVARRSGDITRLRAAWSGAEQALARHAVDLFQLEALEELLVAATRLRRGQHTGPVLDTLQGSLDRLGRPPAWQAALHWLRLQLAVSVEDAAAARLQAEALRTLPPGTARQAAQQLAATCWADVLLGEVDAAAVHEATAQLVGGELPWEASRLAGQAAIRSTDASTARRLLEHARELSSTEPPIDDERAAAAAGLSEREVEVGQLVLAGRTHREIGAQLYLAPKTVEHHVARIRTKLGASNRAEFLAALRAALGTAGEHGRGSAG